MKPPVPPAATPSMRGFLAAVQKPRDALDPMYKAFAHRVRKSGSFPVLSEKFMQHSGNTSAELQTNRRCSGWAVLFSILLDANPNEVSPKIVMNSFDQFRIPSLSPGCHWIVYAS
jgi:hypothetical protein